MEKWKLSIILPVHPDTNVQLYLRPTSHYCVWLSLCQLPRNHYAECLVLKYRVNELSRVEPSRKIRLDSAYASYALYAVPLQKWPQATAICCYGPIAMLHVLCYVFAHTFLFNPHFYLEPDYIIRYCGGAAVTNFLTKFFRTELCVENVLCE